MIILGVDVALDRVVTLCVMPSETSVISLIEEGDGHGDEERFSEVEDEKVEIVVDKDDKRLDG